MEKIEKTAAAPLPDKEKASFKLVVYFKNNTKRTFYNYHTSWNAETKKIIINEKIGLAKLERLLHFKFLQQYKTALIYHIETGIQLKKYCYDRIIQEAPHAWQYDAQTNSVKIKLNQ